MDGRQDALPESEWVVGREEFLNKQQMKKQEESCIIGQLSICETSLHFTPLFGYG